MNADEFLLELLQKRDGLGLLRRLKTLPGTVDFSSNDYLGLARSDRLKSTIAAFISSHPQLPVGSTGSRLLAGNSALAESLEKKIASFHGAETGLLFNSGYDANLGFFSSVPQRNDVVFYDELIHASVHDGMKMGKAETISFRHNNVVDLETKLDEARRKNQSNQLFVAVETLYSMEGDSPPLETLVSVSERYRALLVADEAHATGVIGERGEGLVSSRGLQLKVFARLHTFGKALGCHGAIILGSPALREFLINFARSLIYTTALPYPDLAAIACSYELFPQANEERKKLNEIIQCYRKTTNELFQSAAAIDSPIQSLIIPGNENVKQVANELQKKYDVRALVSPTVPRGKERLRICLHSFNRPEEVYSFLHEVKKLTS